MCDTVRDAFAGGFVAGIVEGKSLEESVDMGHWLASLSIKELGPSYVIFITVSAIPSSKLSWYRQRKSQKTLINRMPLPPIHNLPSRLAFHRFRTSFMAGTTR